MKIWTIFLWHQKCLQNKVLAMIDEEIEHAKVGEQAYIGLKMNSLTDKRIMNKLVEASCAGVHIDMVVRGICCLIPGVKGQTENIHIISIVGVFWSIPVFTFSEHRRGQRSIFHLRTL